MNNKFKREVRYAVFKLKDILKNCSPEQLEKLDEIGYTITVSRRLDGKPPFNAVVVEQDWPEFEMVWAAIEARMVKDVE